MHEPSFFFLHYLSNLVCENIAKIYTDSDSLAGKSTGPKYCYLIPSMFETNEGRFKKSLESLQKNSSSDTEYSMQPYQVIKQSSNETNTSLTGSFNIDQPGAGHELSVDSNDVYTANFTIQSHERPSATDSLESVPPSSKLNYIPPILHTHTHV